MKRYFIMDKYIASISSKSIKDRDIFILNIDGIFNDLIDTIFNGE